MGETEIKGLGIWMPEVKGNELKGEILKLDSDTQFGLQATLKDSKGEEVLTPSHKWLQNCMKRLAVGDKIRIVFDGEEPPKVKGQSPTKKYKVYKSD